MIDCKLRSYMLMLVLTGLLTSCTATPAIERVSGLAATGAVVPVTLERDMPIVELHSQGRTLRLIVDLGGADALAITESALAHLDVRWTGGSKHVSDAFGKSTRSREFVLEDARLGELGLHGVRGYVIPESRLRQNGLPENLDGYIGHGLLGTMNLVVDYPNHRLTLSGGAPPPVDIHGWAQSTFDFSAKGVTSLIDIEGRNLKAVWDTGANHTVIRPRNVPSHLPRRTTRHNEIVTASSIRIGGLDLGPLDLCLLDFTQPNVEVIIGNNLFAEHVVWFDFTNKRLAIDP
jgi:hypothetical protein